MLFVQQQSYRMHVAASLIQPPQVARAVAICNQGCQQDGIYNPSKTT